jgi:hypothetical protein
VTLPPDAVAFPEFYDLEKVWPRESLERRRISGYDRDDSITGGFAAHLPWIAQQLFAGSGSGSLAQRHDAGLVVRLSALMRHMSMARAGQKPRARRIGSNRNWHLMLFDNLYGSVTGRS